MSPPRWPRKALAAAVLMGGLILPISARAAVVRHPAGPAVLESPVGIVLHWFSHLWTAAFEKNGAQTDPDGGPAFDAGPVVSSAGVPKSRSAVTILYKEH
jgi:hypothetical protein